MKKILGIMLLLSVSVTFASETTLLDIRVGDYDPETSMTAQLGVESDSGQAGAEITVTTKELVGPRRTAIISKTSFMEIPGMRLEGKQLMYDSVEGLVDCASFRTRTFLGRIMNTVILTGRCVLEVKTTKVSGGKKIKIVLKTK